ncbi:MAG: hypothetical protein PQ612_09670 [Rickettsiales bacterium]|nr:hypothetical protein [Pseudomonadota bacterium]MDA0966061.1 hypothetical protein [Pseudomonadota bacterium]MDG4544243.1 hypothetical protein [Rickettsiales bacterium]MDG4546422.1 hypothetical protein [Rickettsiales bacterium]MDG4548568.1 hypothetical protein [Rickettsiales bacterium]
MLELNLTLENDDMAINTILKSIKSDIQQAIEEPYFVDLPETELSLFRSFLDYCNNMPERIDRRIKLTKKAAKNFLLHVKSLASSILVSIKTSLRKMADILHEIIDTMKTYVISIACKIWSIFCLIFKSLKELNFEIYFDSLFHGAFGGKVGMVFDNPLNKRYNQP